MVDQRFLSTAVSNFSYKWFTHQMRAQRVMLMSEWNRHHDNDCVGFENRNVMFSWMNEFLPRGRLPTSICHNHLLILISFRTPLFFLHSLLFKKTNVFMVIYFHIFTCFSLSSTRSQLLLMKIISYFVVYFFKLKCFQHQTTRYSVSQMLTYIFSFSVLIFSA